MIRDEYERINALKGADATLQFSAQRPQNLRIHEQRRRGDSARDRGLSKTTMSTSEASRRSGTGNASIPMKLGLGLDLPLLLDEQRC